MKRKVLIWESIVFLAGGQKLALEIAEAIKNNYDVQFLLPGQGKLSGTLTKRGFSYSYYFQNNFSRGKKTFFDILKFCLFSPIAFLSSLSVVIRIQPNLVYSNAAPIFIFSSIIGFLLNRPVIWHVHNYFQDRKTVKLLNIFGRLSNIKKIICDSRALEEQFYQVRSKVTSICPGINLEDFRCFSKNYNVRKELAINVDAHIILQIGWVIRSKGQHLLVEAAKNVFAKRKDVVFLIVGENLEGQERYLKELKQKIEEYQLHDVVRMMGFCNDIQSLISEAFVNVITSFEGFPLVMLEAAAFNLPTIGPDVGGPGVTIENGKSGLIYKFGDTNDLADKILYLLGHKDFYQKMRKNNSEFVNKYTMQRYHNNILLTVKEVLGTPRI